MENLNRTVSTSNQELQRFQELIAECKNLLAGMDTLQLHALIERFSAEIDSRQTLNYLVDGPSLLTCLIARHVVRPDNLTALIAMAEVADRSDLKRSIDRYSYSPPLSSHPGQSIIDEVFTQVASNIQNDWRNLARQLAVTEFEIANIQASTCDQEMAATEMLNLFRRKNPNRDLSRDLVTALRAIRRFSLASKVDDLVKTRLGMVRDLFKINR